MDIVSAIVHGALVSRANDNETVDTWEEICLADPSLAECANVPSFYDYRIDIVPNAVFLALFSASLLAYIVTYAVTRRGLGFLVAMTLGLLCEILGYAGRIMSWQNQWSENGFLMQICCLTIGPAFMAAGIYLCLRRIVYAFGPENSRIPPEYYTRIFIPCDVISLVLQATGGGMASVASHNGTSVDAGDNIMIAGLAFQVLTLLVFMVVSLDFAVRTLQRHRKLGDSALDQNPVLQRIRGSTMFRGFLAALALATVCIFWRSVYRVAELSDGWSGYLMTRQDLFVGFEGVMVVVAVLALNVFHPALSFREMMEGLGGIGSRKKAVIEAGFKSETASDSEAVKAGGVVTA